MAEKHQAHYQGQAQVPIYWEDRFQYIHPLSYGQKINKPVEYRLVLVYAHRLLVGMIDINVRQLS
jgi:hypothetical protein